MRPRALVPTARGTNRDGELAEALSLAGADAEVVPLTVLAERSEPWADRYQLLAVPGGFSHGDALGAGRLLASDLRHRFGDGVRALLDRGRPVIGICNGFQALTLAGLLPGALAPNAGGRFECRWVTLVPSPGSVWTDGLDEPVRCPVAHGEGRYLPPVVGRPRVVLRYGDAKGAGAGGAYPDNPNGSVDDVAGVVDGTGLVLGLMPHPEDHVHPWQEPTGGRITGGSGLALFANGVRAAART